MGPPSGAGNGIGDLNAELGFGGPPSGAGNGIGDLNAELGLGGPASSPKGDSNEMDELGLGGPPSGAEKILKSSAKKSKLNKEAPKKDLGNEASELGGLLPSVPGNGSVGNVSAGDGADLVCNGTQCNDTSGNDATHKSEVNDSSDGNDSGNGNDTNKVVEEAPAAEILPVDGCPPELGDACVAEPKKEPKKAPKPPKPPVKKVWWNGPKGPKKLAETFVPSPLCDPTDITSFANLNCFEKIYHPGFPSTPPDPTGPLGGAMGDS